MLGNILAAAFLIMLFCWALAAFIRGAFKAAAALLLVFLIGFALTGCGPYQTLDELRDEAMVSGDWSKVEQRERALERRVERQGPDCPQGHVAYRDGEHSKWYCVEINAMREALGGL